MSSIKADSSSFDTIINNFNIAKENYISELNRLSNLIDEITSGNIKGVLAEDLKNKYEAKIDTFNALKTSLENAGEYAQQKNVSFNNMISDVQSGMQ